MPAVAHENHPADETRVDDEYVTTGPVPIVALADGHLHLSTRRDVLLAAVDGGLDDDLAATVVPALAEAIDGAEAVVLDLDQATLLDRSAVEALCDVLSNAADAESCVVAARLSGRLVLERWGLPRDVAVFTSVADALQARTFIESGYGSGWARS